MTEIFKKEKIKQDLEPTYIVVPNPNDKETGKKKIRKTHYREGLLLTTIEHLVCGHMNNLSLEGNKSGVCPVFSKDPLRKDVNELCK
jgi:hypothetical protein